MSLHSNSRSAGSRSSEREKKFNGVPLKDLLWRERTLLHIATVAKFLDDNKPKTSLKKWIPTVSNFIDVIWTHLICQI